MKRHMSVGVFLAIAAICLFPLLAYASVTGWSETIVTSSRVGGRATTYDGRPYLTAVMLANVDGVIAAQDYRVMEPAPGGFIIAQKDTSRAGFSSGSHLLEVYGFHEAAELASGADKEVSTSYDDTTFVNGSRAAAEDVSQLSLAVAAKLQSAHQLVEIAFGFGGDDYRYFTYRDHQAIAENAMGLFPDKSTAAAFIEATMRVHQQYLEVGDMGPGYWIDVEGTEAIVGTQKADGTLMAFLVKLNEDGQSWEMLRLGE